MNQTIRITSAETGLMMTLIFIAMLMLMNGKRGQARPAAIIIKEQAAHET